MLFYRAENAGVQKFRTGEGKLETAKIEKVAEVLASEGGPVRPEEISGQVDLWIGNWQARCTDWKTWAPRKRCRRVKFDWWRVRTCIRPRWLQAKSRSIINGNAGPAWSRCSSMQRHPLAGGKGCCDISGTILRGLAITVTTAWEMQRE